jgi:hypothetical protein
MTNKEPYNIEAEKAMLCAMLREPDCIEAAASIAGPGDFSKAHQPIYLRLLQLWQAGKNPDAVTVIHELRENNELEAVGGPVYVTSLTDQGAMGANIWGYAELVKKSADRRRIREAIKSTLQKISTNGNDPLESVGELIEDLQQIRTSQGSANAYLGLTGRVRDYISGIEGTFSTHQLCSDLGITDARGKANIRQILKRLKGSLILPHGSQAGQYRVIRGEVETMDLENAEGEELRLWLPLDLHNYVSIMPGNEIVVTGDPDAGKTAFLLRTIKENLDLWNCHYFNSEMGALELRKRLDLFNGFPITHPHFHAYERGVDFEDVIQPGRYVLNVIDYLEITDEFYLIAKRLSDIYKNLKESVAVIAIQKRSRTSDLPLGAQRALEKPRLAVALTAGNSTTLNRATILKAKNRKETHSMIGKSRTFKLIQGCEFRSDSPIWS